LAGVISQSHFGGNKILKIYGGNRQIKKKLPARSHFVTTFGESQGFQKIKRIQILDNSPPEK
jgi:hypothetical protein